MCVFRRPELKEAFGGVFALYVLPVLLFLAVFTLNELFGLTGLWMILGLAIWIGAVLYVLGSVERWEEEAKAIKKQQLSPEGKAEAERELLEREEKRRQWEAAQERRIQRQQHERAQKRAQQAQKRIDDAQARVDSAIETVNRFAEDESLQHRDWYIATNLKFLPWDEIARLASHPDATVRAAGSQPR